MVVCCLVRKSSGILIGVGVGDFRYNLFLGIGSKNGDGLGEVQGSKEGGNQDVPPASA